MTSHHAGHHHRLSIETKSHLVAVPLEDDADAAARPQAFAGEQTALFIRQHIEDSMPKQSRRRT
jgi:hypothetical protein